MIKPLGGVVASYYRLLTHHRNFALLWLAGVLSQSGESVRAVVFSLFVLAKTDSFFSFSLVLTIAVFPQVVVGPMAGVMVDRLNRKRVLIASDLLRGIAVCILPFVTEVTQIYVIAAFMGLVAVFFFPARSALLPSLLPYKELSTANSLYEASSYIIYLLGSSVAGGLVALVGYNPAFFLDGLTYFGSALLLSQMNVSTIDKTRHAAMKPANVAGRVYIFLEDLLQALNQIYRLKLVFLVFLLSSLTAFAFGFLPVIFPPYAKDVLKGGETGFGFLLSLKTLGGIIGAFLFPLLFSRRQSVFVYISSFLAYGLSYYLMGANTLFILGAVIVILQGASMPGLTIFETTALQTLLAEETLGRAFATFSTISALCGMIGRIAAGYLADTYGLTTVFFLGGSIYALGTIYALLLVLTGRVPRHLPDTTRPSLRESYP